MPAYLPPDLARLAIGLVVAQDQHSGPASSSGWKNAATLVAVLSDEVAVVRPANHRRTEKVPISELRLWLKECHKLGGEAMAKAQRIDEAAKLRADLLKKLTLGPANLDELTAMLGNGENPACLYLPDKDSGVPLPVPMRVVGVRDGKIVIRSGLNVNSKPIDVPVHRVLMPAGRLLESRDWAAIELAMCEDIAGLFNVVKPPEKIPEPVRPVPPPKPAESVKITPPPPAPVPRPAAIEGTPTETPGQAVIGGKAHGTGKWVIVDATTKRFWVGGPGQPSSRWVRDIERARVYEGAGGANVALGVMDREGKTPEPMPLAKAQWFADMWYGQRTKAEDGIPPPAPTPPPVPTPPVGIAAVPSHAGTNGRAPLPTSHPDRDAALARVSKAMREAAAAEAMALEAKAELIRAKAELDIVTLVMA